MLDVTYRKNKRRIEDSSITVPLNEIEPSSDLMLIFAKTIIMQRPAYLLSFLLLFVSFSTSAQEALVHRPSPLAVTTAKNKDAYIKIVYSQPQKRGRDVFGKLVPYGKVWRTGANEATEITTTRDITINNILLRAGTYSLFTIPEKDKWTIIINGELGLWGSYNYNQKLDVLRFEVPVQHIDNPLYEVFTIRLEQNNNVADLLILWDNIKVSIPIKFLN